jgi:hypothetical protein
MSIMSIPKAIDRFDAVCHTLAAYDDASPTRQMVLEVQALVSLYSLDIPEGQTLTDLITVAAETGHMYLIKTGMLWLDSATQQQVKWKVAKASLVYGHLSIAKWLHASFHLSAADVRSDNNSALRCACVKGHLAVVQYLHTAFQLTSEDVRAGDNYALRCAYKRGHSIVVQYLRTTFQLTIENV